jgi:hypothetical protein
LESINVVTTLDRGDYSALVAAARKRMIEARASRAWHRRALPFVVWVVFVAAIVVGMHRWPRVVNGTTLLVALASFLGGIYYMSYLFRAHRRKVSTELLVGRVEFGFDAAGFTVSRATWTTRHQWGSAKAVSHTPTHVFLWIAESSGYTIRVADLPPPMIAQDFVGRLRSFIAAASAMAAPPSTQPEIAAAPAMSLAPAAETTAAAAIPSLGTELLALLRLETRGVADGEALHGRDVTLLLLGVIALALWIVVDRLGHAGQEVVFNWYGVPQLGLLAFWTLSAAWVLARMARPRLEFRRAWLLTLGVTPAIIIAFWLAGAGSVSIAWVGALTLGAIALRFLAGGFRAMTGRAQWPALVAAAVIGIGTYWYSSNYYTGIELWYTPDDESDDDSNQISAENSRILFEQSSRIDALVAAMPAMPTGKQANWFVGFAGFGDQRVFAKEIDKAKREMSERYDTQGRELELINDAQDGETNPIASPESLQHALIDIGRRMNPETDVLFLSLSSHGGDDATLSVSNPRFQLEDELTADDLKAMLDESGIRNRVIVISACYAGSFIDTLADDDTIVLAAAAADKTSFGCANDRDLTYFGEAFYRDALSAHASLRATFEATKTAIAKREKEEGIDASEPQAYWGERMTKRLATIEKN